MSEQLDKYYDISLNKEDFKELNDFQQSKSNELLSKYELNNLEKTMCWIAGLAAGGMDFFLLKAPHFKPKGYLNKKADSFVKNIFSPEQIGKLERANWVPYDAAHSGNLDTKISGLCSRSHRFQSLGHDPILGFFLE